MLTNWHVVRDGNSKVAVAFGAKAYCAAVIGLDKATDVAVLQIGKPDRKPAELGEDPAIGDTVLSTGFGPRSYRAVSGPVIQFVDPGDGRASWYEARLTTRQGDSGGPVFNRAGRVCGLVAGGAGGLSNGPIASVLRRVLSLAKPRRGGKCCPSQRPSGRWVSPIRPNTKRPLPAIQPVNPATTLPDCRNELAVLIKAQAASQVQIDQLMVLVNNLTKQKSIPGPPGKDGKDGLTGPAAVIDYERLAQEVQKRLPPITVQVIKDGEVIDSEDVFLGGVLPLRLVPNQGK